MHVCMYLSNLKNFFSANTSRHEDTSRWRQWNDLAPPVTCRQFLRDKSWLCDLTRMLRIPWLKLFKCHCLVIEFKLHNPKIWKPVFAHQKHQDISRSLTCQSSHRISKVPFLVGDISWTFFFLFFLPIVKTLEGNLSGAVMTAVHARCVAT